MVSAGFESIADPPEYAMVALLIYSSASVSAPAICVVVVLETSFSFVEAMSSRRELRKLSSMSAKGRYLFALSGMVPASVITAYSVEGEEGSDG